MEHLDWDRYDCLIAINLKKHLGTYFVQVAIWCVVSWKVYEILGVKILLNTERATIGGQFSLIYMLAGLG